VGFPPTSLTTLRRRTTKSSPREGSDRNILSFRRIFKKGRIILPPNWPSQTERFAASVHLNQGLGVHPWIIPVKRSEHLPKSCLDDVLRYKDIIGATSTKEVPSVVFVSPGSSKLKQIMDSKKLAFSYTRLCLAVNLSPKEYLKFKHMVCLHPADKTHPWREGYSWYLFSARKGKIPIAFADWCLRHWKRTLGLDPRDPKVIVKLPTLDFLVNYSQSSRLNRGIYISDQGFPDPVVREEIEYFENNSDIRKSRGYLEMKKEFDKLLAED